MGEMGSRFLRMNDFLFQVNINFPMPPALRLLQHLLERRERAGGNDGDEEGEEGAEKEEGEDGEKKEGEDGEKKEGEEGEKKEEGERRGRAARPRRSSVVGTNCFTSV